MSKLCDHSSVGVIIVNPERSIALIERVFFPIGIAPPAGHVDEHGSRTQAAINEVFEEIGLSLDSTKLKEVMNNRRVNNSCKRANGDYHIWSVYTYNLSAEETNNLTGSPVETKQVFWCTVDKLQDLAQRTRDYQAKKINESDWQTNPGLEEVWLDFFVVLGYVE